MAVGLGILLGVSPSRRRILFVAHEATQRIWILNKAFDSNHDMIATSKSILILSMALLSLLLMVAHINMRKLRLFFAVPKMEDLLTGLLELGSPPCWVPVEEDPTLSRRSLFGGWLSTLASLTALVNAIMLSQTQPES